MKYCLLLLVLLVVGCHANVRFNKDTGELVYSRWGNQQLKGFEMDIGADGSMHIEFNSQKGDAGVLGNALKDVSAAVLKLAK